MSAITAFFDSFAFGGAPVGLFRFTHGDDAYCYTNAATPVEYNGDIYAPRTISHSAIRQTGEASKGKITITSPLDIPVAQLYVPRPPDKPVSFTLFRQEKGETFVFWRGRVLYPSFKNGKVEFNCDSIFSGLRQVGLRLVFQPSCPLALYGNRCGANKADFRITGTVSSISGYKIRSDAFTEKPAGWLSNGYLETSAGTSQIVTHKGDEITVSVPIYKLKYGDAITAYAGCDASYATCKNKFNNLGRHLGFTWMPMYGPMEGKPIIW